MKPRPSYIERAIALRESRPDHRPRLGRACPCASCRAVARGVDALDRRLAEQDRRNGPAPF